MKSLRLSMKKTKKGAASLYVVVFATILFGVITVSFARIILSEASQSSNDDLSRSAYDAALAGVEDAKVMVNKYYACLANPSDHDCEAEYNVFSTTQTDCKDNNGYFPLADKMHKVTDGEVLIQETQINSNSETAADQAYTCVLVTDVVPDYRGTLTNETRTKVIPININGTSADNGVDLAKVKNIEFSWFSELNQGQENAEFNESSNGILDTASNKTVPPTMSLRLIKSGSTINLDDMHDKNNKGSVVDSSLLLLPSSSGANSPDSYLEIDSNTIIAAGNADNGSGSLINNPFDIQCGKGKEFACVARLNVQGLGLDNTSNVILVASLPYGDAFTDFAVKLLDENNNVVKLRGVQISVDSTGRTNQLVRRVETRLDPADMFFPYPQYALELSGGDGDNSLNKNFWITANCWYSTPQNSASLSAGVCANNGTI